MWFGTLKERPKGGEKSSHEDIWEPMFQVEKKVWVGVCLFCRKINKEIDVATHDEKEDNVREVVGNQGLVGHCDNCHFT